MHLGCLCFDPDVAAGQDRGILEADARPLEGGLSAGSLIIDGMSLSVEDRRPALSPQLCTSCGARLYPTIVGPRCPIHGAEGAR